jgi:hypothetical protein
VQSYGSKELDASLLLLSTVGFLPPTDPRIHGTIAPSNGVYSSMASWFARISHH